jgi:hypothetical protein
MRTVLDFQNGVALSAAILYGKISNLLGGALALSLISLSSDFISIFEILSRI